MSEVLIPYEFNHYKSTWDELLTFIQQNKKRTVLSVLDYEKGNDFYASKTGAANKGIRLDKQDSAPIFEMNDSKYDEYIAKVESLCKDPVVKMPNEKSLEDFAAKAQEAILSKGHQRAGRPTRYNPEDAEGGDREDTGQDQGQGQEAEAPAPRRRAAAPAEQPAAAPVRRPAPASAAGAPARPAPARPAPARPASAAAAPARTAPARPAAPAATAPARTAAAPVTSVRRTVAQRPQPAPEPEAEQQPEGQEGEQQPEEQEGEQPPEDGQGDVPAETAPEDGGDPQGELPPEEQSQEPEPAPEPPRRATPSARTAAPTQQVRRAPTTPATVRTATPSATVRRPAPATGAPARRPVGTAQENIDPEEHVPEEANDQAPAEDLAGAEGNGNGDGQATDEVPPTPATARKGQEFGDRIRNRVAAITGRKPAAAA